MKHLGHECGPLLLRRSNMTMANHPFALKADAGTDTAHCLVSCACISEAVSCACTFVRRTDTCGNPADDLGQGCGTPGGSPVHVPPDVCSASSPRSRLERAKGWSLARLKIDSSNQMPRCNFNFSGVLRSGDPGVKVTVREGCTRCCGRHVVELFDVLLPGARMTAEIAGPAAVKKAPQSSGRGEMGLLCNRRLISCISTMNSHLGQASIARAVGVVARDKVEGLPSLLSMSRDVPS